MAEGNLPAFEVAAAKLRLEGYRPMVPHWFTNKNMTWTTAMKRCIETLIKCEGLCLIDEATSKGCAIEKALAFDLGIPIKTLDEWIAVGANGR